MVGVIKKHNTFHFYICEKLNQIKYILFPPCFTLTHHFAMSCMETCNVKKLKGFESYFQFIMKSNSNMSANGKLKPIYLDDKHV